MAGQFDRIVEELYNKVALGKGYCDELLSEEGLEYLKELIEFYEKPEIIETYQSGSSWYRVYRDGWCEQGSRVQISAADQVVTLLKPFKTTDYTITASGGTRVYGNTACFSRTTTNFKAWTSDDSSFNAGELSWEARGYIF